MAAPEAQQTPSPTVMRRYVLESTDSLDGLVLEQDAKLPDITSPTQVSDERPRVEMPYQQRHFLTLASRSVLGSRPSRSTRATFRLPRDSIPRTRCPKALSPFPVRTTHSSSLLPVPLTLSRRLRCRRVGRRSGHAFQGRRSRSARVPTGPPLGTSR